MPQEHLHECLVCDLGRVVYSDAAALQQALVQARFEDRVGDTLLLLEHPPTITLGRFAKSENILLPPEILAQRGIDVQKTNRGGDVTFHCPGQLVVHPILDLRRRPGVLRRYISDLEEVALRVLKGYDIPAQRSADHPGLWLEGKQIAALGLHFTHGISMHGLSLNVNPDLSSFEVINLCGVPGCRAASIAGELKRDVSVPEVSRQMMDSFAEVFRYALKPVSRKELEGECLVTAAARLV